MKKKYSKLSESQRAALQAQGCTSDSWDSIEVGDGFRTDFVRDAHFGGKVRLGANGTPVELPGGVVRRSGIYRAALHDCTVGDGVLIANVGRYMARYDVEDGAVIENVGQIICDGRSSFGNGVEVTTTNEAGGREVPIYDGLTAQIAYVLAMYRHRTRTVERLRGLIARYAESRTASRGAIGRGSSVVNTLSLLNVSVGEGASIDGAASLCNGTLNSTFEYRIGRDGERLRRRLLGYGRYRIDAAPLFRRRGRGDRERILGRELALFCEQPSQSRRGVRRFRRAVYRFASSFDAADRRILLVFQCR